MAAETSKTTTCTGFVLTGVGTRPIIRGPWHRACLTELNARAWRTTGRCWSASIRSSELARLQDLLADSSGSVQAQFAFASLAGGRAGATVSVQAMPRLVCQRCTQGFEYAVASESEIEFAATEAEAPADSPREIYVMDEGWVSLRELAEEELLLALPIVAACSTPENCGRAPSPRAAEPTTRPFAGLQDLLKKT